jgi:hypothetical protein
MTSKYKPKNKINKMDIISIEIFCASKDTIKKVKRQSTEWDKIFENHMSDKGHISRVNAELLPLCKKKKEENGIEMNKIHY